jgi:hypothetical protein
LVYFITAKIGKKARRARVEERRIKVTSAELIRSHGGSKLSVIEFFI